MMTTKQREARHNDIQKARNAIFNADCYMENSKNKSQQEKDVLKTLRQVRLLLDKLAEDVLRIPSIEVE